MKAPISLKSYKGNAAKGQKAIGGASDSVKFNDTFLPFALYRHPGKALAKAMPQARKPSRSVFDDLASEFKKIIKTN